MWDSGIFKKNTAWSDQKMDELTLSRRIFQILLAFGSLMDQNQTLEKTLV